MLSSKRKIEYQRAKRKVQKLFPNAKIKRDRFKNFYVVDKNGFKILQDEFSINNQLTIFDTWKKTAEMIWFKHIIEVNNQRFNDDKIFKSLNRHKDKEFYYKD
ncbi:hypothetical protein M0P65_06545 [Candidatus Gracilibacteria bacterium]|jgi:hypothetical protein|nr:hypothetical protein [Candidatus Gracilibacteria bacterium]